MDGWDGMGWDGWMMDWWMGAARGEKSPTEYWLAVDFRIGCTVLYVMIALTDGWMIMIMMMRREFRLEVVDFRMWRRHRFSVLPIVAPHESPTFHIPTKIFF